MLRHPVTRSRGFDWQTVPWSSFPGGLAEVIRAWSKLPAALQAAVLAIVRTVTDR
jgi:hypothetical protein